MNYEDMSDFEINKLVVQLKCKGQLIKILPQRDAFDPIESGVMSSDVHIITGSGREQSINPCNSPSDAWPVIEIMWERLMQVDAYYQAHTRWEAYCIEHDVGKLRAAMICFLEVKDAEQ